jgi:bifunctional DNase/RNase
MVHEVEVAGMGVDSESQAPVLLLRQKYGTESVPVIIGLFEASSIVMALKDEDPKRPMTHDLFSVFIKQVGMSVEKVVIHDLQNGVYFASIYYKNKGSDSFFSDARPSDAVALALRFDAPIFIEEQVLQQAKKTFTLEVDESFEKAEIADTSDQGRKWAEYLKNLSPDEFGKYKV